MLDRDRIVLIIDEPFNRDIASIYRVPKGEIIGGLFGADSKRGGLQQRMPQQRKISLWLPALPLNARLCQYVYISIKARKSVRIARATERGTLVHARGYTRCHDIMRLEIYFLPLLSVWLRILAHNGVR